MADIQISDDRARTFADALQTFEKDGDVAAFAALFADNAVTQRLDARGERRGEVEQFWKEYRDQFTSISTSFSSQTVARSNIAASPSSTSTATRSASCGPTTTPPSSPRRRRPRSVEGVR